MPKNAQTTTQLHSCHNASKVMLKILQARLQQYMNCELLDVQADFRKDRGTWGQIANICWIIKKTREFKKNIFSALLTMPKPLTVWIAINCGKFWKTWEYQTTLIYNRHLINTFNKWFAESNIKARTFIAHF